jgi:hypothetical protein
LQSSLTIKYLMKFENDSPLQQMKHFILSFPPGRVYLGKLGN